MARGEADRDNWFRWMNGLREEVMVEGNSANILEHGEGVVAV